ncbi:lipase chaperone [Shewanella sp. D64]|uniref:lipase chaperone family protein n=1 Tax=unclassified Shewanella TaxID=196818 RepID=UPI0022BA4159|nr:MULTISPECIES: lipase chaperone family protein [unclassified Shewanella]MEC4726953.1 lipase chaperone [Shewanella sp. D64]MEC4738550.1 lipase chaperone [Shewanella sp. E94]WBJ93768.1 lipase chaperone [Shewanella sp. MTB7]
MQNKSSNNSPLPTARILLLSLILILMGGGLIYFNGPHDVFEGHTLHSGNEIPQTQPELVAEGITTPISTGLSQLILNQQLRWDFDDLILTHQETGQTITSLLFALSKQRNLTPDAHHYLMDLFNRYRDYKIALVEVKKMGPNMLNELDIEDTLDFIERAHQSQFDYFTQIEIDAFFSDENAYDIQAIERMAILQDSSLSSEQKQMLIAHQISQMDAEEREVYEPSLQVFNIVDNLEGKSSQLNEFTPEVIERIEQLKKDEQVWKTKITDFLAFQVQSRNEQTDDTLAQETIDNYQNRNFSANELKRLQVYIDNPELLNTH